MPAAVNGITATSNANTKAIKSKNQLRRAKAKQKKAAAVPTPVSLIRVFSLPTTDAGDAGTQWRRLEWGGLGEASTLGELC